MREAFQPLPENEPLQLAWPTRRRDLFTDPSAYVVQTPANPDYGKPGWTRDAGRRMHRGVDVAPLRRHSTAAIIRLNFTDLSTGREYETGVPGWQPEDDVYAVADGVVEEAVTREADSDFGLHVVVRHVWPQGGHPFYTLYGHLASVQVSVGQVVRAGAWLGGLGATSRIPDARNWMAAFPHLHFEVRDAEQRRYDPLDFLRRYLSGTGI